MPSRPGPSSCTGSGWIEDLLRIADRGARIVQNPGANTFLGDGIAPLLRIRQLGIPVSLGTDEGCTNNRLSMPDEVRMAPLLQRAPHADGSLLTAREALSVIAHGRDVVVGGALVAFSANELRERVAASMARTRTHIRRPPTR